MKLVSIDSIPGRKIEAIGIVKGTVVQTKNVGRDIMAGFKTLVGGEIVSYTQMLNEARQIATKRMVDEAEELGADAVVGIRYGSSQIMSSAAEIVAYGTAVKFLD
ncbi:MAG: YbjQ family protein [Sphaerochaetaceae bacterium]|nr:YbjQ family protein [Sphaerochaetaceae bacterium]